MMPVVSVTFARALRELAAETPLSLRISGDCMAPLLASGAVVRIARRRFYCPGDPVVVHALDGRLLVHRLLGSYSRGRGWRWLTQADNAPWPDTPLPLASVIGKVVGGDCHAHVIHVPFRHRLWACGRFLRHALRAARRRW